MNYRLSLLALLALQVSLNANADQRTTAEWVPTTQKLTLEGNSQNGAKLNGFVGRVNLTAKLYETTTYTVKTSKTQCDNTLNGDGSKGDWNGFYNVPRAEKAKALAAAIKGIGLVSAEYLVDLFLKDKPDSWSEFTRVIRDAERVLDQRGLVQSGWGTKVVETYAAENQRNLGYASRDCRTVVSSEKKTRRDLVKEHYATVDLQALNLSLLPGEHEVVSVTYDGRNVTVQTTQNYNYISNFVSKGAFYNGSAHSMVTLTGSRKRTQVANNVDVNRSRLANDGTIALAHSAYYPLLANYEFERKCRLYANVTLYAVTGNIWNREESVLGSREVELELNQGVTRLKFDVGNALNDSKDGEVRFTVRASDGCPFYNNRASLERTFAK
jgi:hypothetical protein